MWDFFLLRQNLCLGGWRQNCDGRVLGNTSSARIFACPLVFTSGTTNIPSTRLLTFTASHKSPPEINTLIIILFFRFVKIYFLRRYIKIGKEEENKFGLVYDGVLNENVDGKVKAVELSNFSKEQVQEIPDICEVKPTVLQVEAHPYYPENELKEFLSKHDIKANIFYIIFKKFKKSIDQNVSIL